MNFSQVKNCFLSDFASVAAEIFEEPGINRPVPFKKYNLERELCVQT